MPGAFSVDAPMPDDGHGQRSFDLAETAAECRQGYRESLTFSPGAFLRNHPDARHVPIRQIVTEEVGSVERYCSTTTAASVNKENSLFLIEDLLIRSRPNISLA